VGKFEENLGEILRRRIGKIWTNSKKIKKILEKNGRKMLGLKKSEILGAGAMSLVVGQRLVVARLGGWELTGWVMLANVGVFLVWLVGSLLNWEKIWAGSKKFPWKKWGEKIRWGAVRYGLLLTTLGVLLAVLDRVLIGWLFLPLGWLAGLWTLCGWLALEEIQQHRWRWGETKLQVWHRLWIGAALLGLSFYAHFWNLPVVERMGVGLLAVVVGYFFLRLGTGARLRWSPTGSKMRIRLGVAGVVIWLGLGVRTLLAG